MLSDEPSFWSLRVASRAPSAGAPKASFQASPTSQARERRSRASQTPFQAAQMRFRALQTSFQAPQTSSKKRVPASAPSTGVTKRRSGPSPSSQAPGRVSRPSQTLLQTLPIGFQAPQTSLQALQTLSKKRVPAKRTRPGQCHGHVKGSCRHGRVVSCVLPVDSRLFLLCQVSSSSRIAKNCRNNDCRVSQTPSKKRILPSAPAAKAAKPVRAAKPISRGSQESQDSQASQAARALKPAKAAKLDRVASQPGWPSQPV